MRVMPAFPARLARLSLLTSLMLAPACGDSPADPPDAAPPADSRVPDATPDAAPPGLCEVELADGGVAPTYQYVLDAIDVPENSDQAEDLGMDLDGDGSIDNQIGNIIGALVSVGGGLGEVQQRTARAVDEGGTITLAQLWPCSTGAFATYHGANPRPAACDGAGDTVCRHHLDGTGAFDIAAGTPTSQQVVGTTSGDVFTGGPGELALPLALFGGEPALLTLTHAQVRLDGVSADGFATGTIAGGIPEEQVQAALVPAVYAGVSAQIASECTGVGLDCGCEPSSTAVTLLGIFDVDNDCAVTLPEIQDNPLIATLLGSDLDTDADGTADALSIGVGVHAVRASFTAP